MPASVDGDLPCFETLADAIAFVAERGGGEVRTAEPVFDDTYFAKGLREMAEKAGVRLVRRDNRTDGPTGSASA